MNHIESKHNIIRSIFIRLKEQNGDSFVPEIAAYQAFTISNEIHGNNITSAFEIAKGFTKPLKTKQMDTVVPRDV